MNAKQVTIPAGWLEKSVPALPLAASLMPRADSTGTRPKTGLSYPIARGCFLAHGAAVLVRGPPCLHIPTQSKRCTPHLLDGDRKQDEIFRFVFDIVWQVRLDNKPGFKVATAFLILRWLCCRPLWAPPFARLRSTFVPLLSLLSCTDTTGGKGNLAKRGRECTKIYVLTLLLLAGAVCIALGWERGGGMC